MDESSSRQCLPVTKAPVSTLPPTGNLSNQSSTPDPSPSKRSNKRLVCLHILRRPACLIGVFAFLPVNTPSRRTERSVSGGMPGILFQTKRRIPLEDGDQRPPSPHPPPPGVGKGNSREGKVFASVHSLAADGAIDDLGNRDERPTPFKYPEEERKSTPSSNASGAVPCKYIPCALLSFRRSSSCAWLCSLPASSRLPSFQARSPPLWGRRFLLHATASDQPSCTASNRRNRHPMLVTTHYPSTAFLYLLHPTSTSLPLSVRTHAHSIQRTFPPPLPPFPPAFPHFLLGVLPSSSKAFFMKIPVPRSEMSDPASTLRPPLPPSPFPPSLLSPEFLKSYNL